MKVLYTPYRGKDQETFETIEEMKIGLANEHYNKDDITIVKQRKPYSDTEFLDDMVCIKRFDEVVYKFPQCIGYAKHL